MIRRFIGIAVVAASVALPFAAQAQGVPGGVERGSREGERAAGPVGAIVGGVIGGVGGGVNGVLGVDDRPRFALYVVSAPSISTAKICGSAPLAGRRRHLLRRTDRIWRSGLPLHGRQWPHGSSRAAQPRIVEIVE